jgi:hypothetical protein
VTQTESHRGAVGVELNLLELSLSVGDHGESERIIVDPNGVSAPRHAQRKIFPRVERNLVSAVENPKLS